MNITLRDVKGWTLFRDVPDPPAPQYCGGCLRFVPPLLSAKYWEDENFHRYTIFDDIYELFTKARRNELRTVFEFVFPCVCDLKPPYSHWVLAVLKRENAGWDPPDEEPRGGSPDSLTVHIEGGSAPRPLPCMCGRMVEPIAWSDYWVLSGYKLIWGEDQERFKAPPPGRKSLHITEYWYPCPCQVRSGLSRSHWIQDVLRRKTPGWCTTEA